MWLRILAPQVFIFCALVIYFPLEALIIPMFIALGISLGLEFMGNKKVDKQCPYFGDRDYQPGCKGCKEYGVMDQCGDEDYYEEEE